MAGLFDNLTHVGDSTPVEPGPELEVGELALPLMDFQRTNVKEALSFNRCLLASDMGTGKTAVMLSVTVACIEAGIRPVVWVVPPGLRTNTQREMDKFAPSLTVQFPSGKTPTCLADTDVIVIGDSVVADWAETIVEHGVGALCVDEVHRQKSFKARRSQGTKTIARAVPKGHPIIAASGTPLPNHPAELCSPLDILGVLPQFGGIRNFLDTYCPKLKGNRWGARGIDFSELSNLNKRLLDKCMIRTLKEDVLDDLPDHGRLIMALDMDDKTKAEYRQAERNLIEFLRDTRGYSRARLARVDKAEALVQLGVLRELAGLGVVDSTVEYVESLTSRQLPGEAPEKVVVFTQHRSVVAALHDAIEGSVVVQGGMGDKAKMASVDRFQTDDQCLVLIGNATAAGVGLNLTAGRHTVHVQLGWNAAGLTQCEDRCHRIGADERGVVSHIIFPDLDQAESVTERMYHLISAKFGISSEVIDGEVGASLIEESVQDALIDLYSSY
jgi:SWI/SNF-related matrix-associated actin-dependent regulator 1 of chromatin subfamily A